MLKEYFCKKIKMGTSNNLYQSILLKLGHLPINHLQQVDHYLDALILPISPQQESKSKILALFGSWSDMEEADYQDFLKEAKSVGTELFSKEVAL
jgi:hypothetical protein